MTDQEQQAADADGQTQEPQGRKGKLIAIASAALLLLVSGGAGGAYLLGMFGDDSPPTANAHAEVDTGEIGHGGGEAAADEGHDTVDQAGEGNEGLVFVDLPDVLVNLQSSGKRMRFLKMRVALEASDHQVASNIKKLMPRIMDSFQMYLRALTIEEVSNPASLHRLKEELTARTNYAISPNRVDDVLVKELLVQ